MSNARENRVPRPAAFDVGGLIPPGELFGRVLPVPRFIDADLPFEERVERAWARLLAGFEEEEHERLRAVLVELVAFGHHEDK